MPNDRDQATGAGEISYRVRCAVYENWATGRKQLQGGCGESPLHRDMARRGHIACRCGLEWPFVRLVTVWPEAIGEGSLAAPVPPLALQPPSPPQPPPENPHAAKLRAKMAQGNLF